MSCVNNSRPAAGTEHHYSHYLEMQYLFQRKEALLHGIKVGITSILVAKMYETLVDEGIKRIKKSANIGRKVKL